MYRTLIAAIVALILAIRCTQAAEIQVGNSHCFFSDDKCDWGPDSVLIRGTIVEGDSAKFRNVIIQNNFALDTVILRSNGGNLHEAMTIGKDIRQLLMETEGPILNYYTDREERYGNGDHPLCPENGVGDYIKGSRYKGSECVCASACFFLYVAGVRRALSYVGIHRGYVRPDISRDQGLDTAAEMYRRISKPIADYLRDMGVPPRYADIMLRTSSQEIYVPKYPEVMADFFGWIPEIEEWLIAKCDTVSERQMAEEERKALNAGGEQFRQFLESRNLREACIQISVAGERVKRRTQYLSLGGRN